MLLCCHKLYFGCYLVNDINNRVGLGVTYEKYLMWKDGFKATYEEARVKILEYGYRLPKFKRSGWRNCGNY